MVFKDIVSVVGLNSWHTKLKLMAKSPTKKNIKVIRHPDHRVLPGTESSFLFSHHEKTVIIDQKIAFIGGIDLCWGRWDTDQHRFTYLTFYLLKMKFISNRLVDLGDENITKLKLSDELDEEEEEQKDEAAVEITEKMAENVTGKNIVSANLN
jgi:hypothetical protein